MKKLVGLAAAGLFAAGAAQAGNLTVANSDITLYGGISAGLDYASTDLGVGVSNALAPAREDNFRLYNVAIGLMKQADPNNSPIGFNLSFAYFYVPTVVASPNVVNGAQLIKLGTTDTFKPWLGYLTIAPVEGLSIDAGLLWAKYGEAPVTILNPHINRGILFVHYNPVLFAGLRVNYSIEGLANVYVGYNQGGGLFQGTASGLGRNIEDAIEAGVSFNLDAFKVGLHMYDEATGKNFYTLSLRSEVAGAKAGVQIFLATEDDKIQNNTTDDSSWGAALFVQPQLTDTISVPVRIEYENTDAKTDDSIWTFTITPTWKPTTNTYARVEVAYTSWKNKFGKISDGTLNKDSRTIYALEIGYLF